MLTDRRFGQRFARVRTLSALPRSLGMLLLPLAGHLAFGAAGLYAATALAVAWTAVSHLRGARPIGSKPVQDTAGDDDRATLTARADAVLSVLPGSGRTTACLLISMDDVARLRDRLGLGATAEVTGRTETRLRAALREEDWLGPLGEGLFGIVMAPTPRLDLEALVDAAARLQRAAADPVPVAGTSVEVSLTIGFVQAERIPNATGSLLVDAAEIALREAQSHGHGAIRAYSSELESRHKAETELKREAADALEQGQIRAWFQPQISTDTGGVTGFEALARWHHPVRGLIPPGVFLPVLESAGLTARLGEVMLHQGLTALRAWDRAGEQVPRLGINFTLEDLRSTTLIDRIAWELDRFGLAPERLAVEILENVVAEEGDDIVARNISGLADLGCHIDLDDFGTGHASITSIRRFPIDRLKIDRSFVHGVHEDREKQRLVSAILTMAERLEIETIAEGVESVGEHTLLAQLGCHHVQGFGIARPMPLEATFPWLTAHRARILAPPTIGRASG